MKRIMRRVVYFLSIFIVATACSDNLQQDQLPPATFNEIIIDLNLPQYRDLASDGGYESIANGVAGIIIYRENASTYHAIEQNCTYLPFEAGSSVFVDKNNPILLRDATCGSIFNLPDVFPSRGPAVIPLRKYKTILTGRTLTIINEQIN
ncbi:hypothetical protein FNH22_24010 [Fulvivirga sp. M361]|uniref:hypothetical protein n=1 Tax=Fulvivirga sp. M361 TaxID=2594266 RepID=UPI00117ACDEB|nr:hypothetical protein [Fulvivirga sp. M361]TRX51629.1 hypothetical protein FNH22_24010 [Fulvivirga sp. M361]